MSFSLLCWKVFLPTNLVHISDGHAHFTYITALPVAGCWWSDNRMLMHDSMGTTQSSELANQPVGSLQEACFVDLYSICGFFTLVLSLNIWFIKMKSSFIHMESNCVHRLVLNWWSFSWSRPQVLQFRGACHHARHRPLPSCFSVILSGQGVSYVFVSMISILDRNDLRERGLSHSLFLRIQPIMTLKIHLTHQLTAGQPENRERRILRLHIILFPAAREFPLETPTETYLEIWHNLLGCYKSFSGTEKKAFEFGGNS